MEKILVVGDGAWGTALAMLLAQNGASVIQWSHSPERARLIQTTRENTDFLPGHRLPPSITVTGSADALEHADLIVGAVPSRFLRAVFGSLAARLVRGRPVVSVTKGIEFPSRKRPTQVLRDVIGDRPLAVLSGPSHAEEVAAKLPTAVVVASADRGLALRVQDLFTTDWFRVYTSDDVVGVEMGGALKNVLAIAGGLVDGLGMGDNTKAALLTRGQAEMSRLGVALGGRPETFAGLSGMGDLFVSCVSGFGRNRLVGERIGQGERIDDVLDNLAGVPEGVLTSKAVVDLAASLGLEMPICQEVHEVLFEGKDPSQAVRDLMTRPQKDEVPVS